MEINEQVAQSSDPTAQIVEALWKIRIGQASGGGLLGRPRGQGFSHRHDPHGHGHRKGHGGRRGVALGRLLLMLSQSDSQLGVGEIGALIGVDQPRASRLVAQGVEEGLLTRIPDEADARRLTVALTKQGHAAVDDMLASRRASVDQALDGFSRSEREQLSQLLSRLAANWPAP